MITFMLNSCPVNGQIKAQLMQKAISDKKFIFEFQTCKSDSILLYDENSVINFRDNLFSCGKNVIIVRDSVYKVLPGRYSIHNVYNLIVLYNVITNRNGIILMFWRPYSGASLRLKYKYRKGDYKIVEQIVGTF